MGRSADFLIPSRFLLTAGNFITVVLAYYNVGANVASGTVGGGADAARSSLLAALSISIIAFAPQFFGLFSGWTLFLDELNLFHSVMHFFGGVLTAWYLIDSWGYKSYWCALRFPTAAPPSPPPRGASCVLTPAPQYSIRQAHNDYFQPHPRGRRNLCTSTPAHGEARTVSARKKKKKKQACEGAPCLYVTILSSSVPTTPATDQPPHETRLKPPRPLLAARRDPAR